MRLIRQIFRSRSEQKLAFYTEQFARAAEKELEGICQIRGPSPAPLEKSEDFYRWHIWYFCPSVKPVVAAILSLKKKFPMDEDIDDVLDVDPMSLM